MSRWALLDVGRVTAVVEQAATPGAGWVNVAGLVVGPGYTLSGSTWTAPPAPPALEPVITRAQLLAARTALGLTEGQIGTLWDTALPAS